MAADASEAHELGLENALSAPETAVSRSHSLKCWDFRQEVPARGDEHPQALTTVVISKSSIPARSSGRIGRNLSIRGKHRDARRLRWKPLGGEQSISRRKAQVARCPGAKRQWTYWILNECVGVMLTIWPVALSSVTAAKWIG